jgi:toxin ParE1/3/4
MPRLRFTSLADADTAAILEDLASKAGPVVAEKYLDRFESLYAQLSTYPQSGPPRPALGDNIRIAIAAPFIVIYRHQPQDDTVTILRLVHGRRRITGALLRTP